MPYWDMLDGTHIINCTYKEQYEYSVRGSIIHIRGKNRLYDYWYDETVRLVLQCDLSVDRRPIGKLPE